MGGQASGLLEAVRQIVLESGKLIVEASRKPKQLRAKGRIDLVTDTDLAVEEFLAERLLKLYPEADCLAEEGTPQQRLGRATWVIDPLDGTTNFAHSLPFVATSLALWRDNRVELGVVNLPLLGECYWAELGQGAFCNGARLSVSRTPELDQALLATGFPYNITEVLPVVVERLTKALHHCQGVRRCGAAAMDLAYTAAGRFDCFYEEGLKPWDMAAGALLIREAGGLVTRLDGSVFSLEFADILTANPALHAKLLEVFRN